MTLKITDNQYGWLSCQQLGFLFSLGSLHIKAPVVLFEAHYFG